ncbi:MAG: hypothetical protein HC834_05455 [Rhodospirillales bacterium]|nr:hypothetical protein [Rhodospirillales bacterium]
MWKIPQAVRVLLEGFANEFTPSVWQRFSELLIAAVMLRGRRTIWRLLRWTSGSGHFSSYHRVFSHRCWSSVALSRRLAVAVVGLFAPEGVLQLVGDDTVSQHRGEHVYGKGCHRDAVRSSHSHLVHRWGHKWVVLALRVRVPGASRTWALPLLIALYRTPEESGKAGARHKTPPELMRGLLALWMRWFPQRKAVFSGDGGFATHALAGFAARHGRRLSLVSRFPPDAVLHDPPPRRKAGRTGRPRVVGKRLPRPCEAVQSKQKRRRLHVAWYGGGRRKVEVVTGEGHWYRQGKGLVRVRWVHVRDLSGSHREEYLFSTDGRMSVARIIEAFVGRWDIEVTFAEMREHLGLETTRGRSRNTVLRAEPCLFALYTLIVYWYVHLPKKDRQVIHAHWRGKTTLTFTDAMASVRRNAWDEFLFQPTPKRPAIEKLTRKTRNAILNALGLAA